MENRPETPTLTRNQETKSREEMATKGAPKTDAHRRLHDVSPFTGIPGTYYYIDRASTSSNGRCKCIGTGRTRRLYICTRPAGGTSGTRGNDRHQPQNRASYGCRARHQQILQGGQLRGGRHATNAGEDHTSRRTRTRTHVHSN